MNRTQRSTSPTRASRTRRLIAGGIAVLAFQLVGVGPAGATTPTGRAFAFGANAYGELGNNTTTASSTPVLVSGVPNGVVQIAAGARHSFALLGDGTIKAWGRNAVGELGDATTTDHHVPVTVHVLGAGSGVIAVAANAPPLSTTSVSGAGHSMALKSNGTVWAWGNNNSGEQGDGEATGPQICGTTPCSTIPRQVPGVSGVTKIAAGGGFDMALKADGTVLTWGYNASGQLGIGTNTGPDNCGTVTTPKYCSSSPVQAFASGSGVVQIAAGDAFGVALKSDGSVWTWGNNASGQLGNNSTTDTSTPAAVAGLTGVSKIAAGAAFVLAIKTDGSVWAWGNNTSGQIGDNNKPNDRLTPTQVTGLGAGSGVVTVSAGFSHVLALRSNGTLLGWGHDKSGQLGDRATLPGPDVVVPKVIAGMTPVKQVSAGGSHTLVVESPTVSVTPSRGPIGTPVKATGSRFRQGETVNVYYQTRLSAPSRVAVCSAVVTSTTSYSCSGKIPTTNFGPLGPHSIVAIGATSGLRAAFTFTLTPTVAVTPKAGAAGTHVTVSGSHFAASESVSVYWLTKLPSPSQILLCTVTTTSGGGLSCAATVPTSNQGPAGAHTITATGVVSNVAGTTQFTLQ